MSINKHVLKNILSKNYLFCAICFDTTLEDNSCCMEDELVITNKGTDNTLRVTDMLHSVLGEEVMNVISIFEHICKQCIRSAVASYKFIKISKENALALQTSLENLNKSVEKAIDNHYLYKSVIVTIDPQDLSTQEFYDTNSLTSSLSSICKKIDSLTNTNEEASIKYESGTSIVKAFSGKRRKKHSNFLSVPLKTTEMLFDKDDRTNLKCKDCTRVYPSLSNLRNHYIRVHAPKNYKCSSCNRSFGSMGLLEQHKHQSHCTLVCTECGKTFYNRHTLKMHEIGHYIRIVCEDCGRVYKSRTTYKKHIDLNVCGRKTRAHPSDAKFTCDYCNKKYTQKVSLRVHIQYEHGNYKAHVCKWCNKKFWARSRLKAHIVKHTQEKKFTCNICGGKFVSKESLLYHTRIHTGEKPYKCDFCDNHFLSASRRADHVKRQHPRDENCDDSNRELFLEKHKITHTVTNENVGKQNLANVLVEEENMIYLKENKTSDKDARAAPKGPIFKISFGHVEPYSQILGL